MVYPSIQSMNNNAQVGNGNERADRYSGAGVGMNDNGRPSANTNGRPSQPIEVFQTSQPTIVYQNLLPKRASSEPTQAPTPQPAPVMDRAPSARDSVQAAPQPIMVQPMTPAVITFVPDEAANAFLEREKKLSHSMRWELRKKRLACCGFCCALLVLIPWMIVWMIESVLISHYALPVCVHEDRTKCNSCFDKVENSEGQQVLDNFHNVTEKDFEKDGDWFETRDMHNLFASEHWEFATAERMSHGLRRKGHHPRHSKDDDDDEDDHDHDDNHSSTDEGEDNYRRLQAAYKGNLRGLMGGKRSRHGRRGRSPTGLKNSTTEPEYTELEYESDFYFRPGSYESCLAGPGPMTKKFLIENKNVSKLCYRNLEASYNETTKHFNFTEKPDNQSCGYIGLRGVDVVTSHIFMQNQAINRKKECEEDGFDSDTCDHEDRHHDDDRRRLMKKNKKTGGRKGINEKKQRKLAKKTTMSVRKLGGRGGHDHHDGSTRDGSATNTDGQVNNGYTYEENTMYDGEDGTYNYYYSGDTTDEYYYEPYPDYGYHTYDYTTGPNGEAVYYDTEGKAYYHDYYTGEVVYMDQSDSDTLYYTTTGNAKFVHVCGRGEKMNECNDRCDCLGGHFHSDHGRMIVWSILCFLGFWFAVIFAAFCYVKWNNKWVRYEELKDEREALRANSPQPHQRALNNQVAPSPRPTVA